MKTSQATNELIEEVKVLRERRKGLGWTQQELAARAGISKVYLAMLETGMRANPGLRLIRAIEGALEAGELESSKSEVRNSKPDGPGERAEGAVA